MTNDTDAPPLDELLAAALRDPLPVPLYGSPAHEWFRQLHEQFPLWSFQPFAYFYLHDTELPTTFPLQVIIDSIVEDDNLAGEDRGTVEPPLATVDRRRGWLAGTATELGPWEERLEWHFDDGEPVELSPSIGPQLTRPAKLFDPGSESEYHYDPPRHIGEEPARRLAELVEARDHARGEGDTETLREAQRLLDNYLQETGISTGAGRPTEGPPPKVLEALYREGEALLDLCWAVWRGGVEDDVVRLLAEYDDGVLDPSAWALNLALPILSTVEIRVLTREIEADWDGTAPTPGPTPRRTAVAILSHRLGMTRPAIARRIWDSGGAVEEFQALRDPFAL